jgi:exopolyphosphatase / guanosine-5'-triphosphate,3'-diphosphate pyrophosphatase
VYNSQVRKATIDVGSNSVLLLVGEYDGSRWTPVAETSEVTALGEDTSRTRLLGEDAMVRTLAALRRAFDHAAQSGATGVRAGATMAARIADNAGDFLRRATEQGTPFEILSGETEAELGFLAVASDPLFEGAGRISIVDPGGQSTEMTTADRTPTGWRVGFRRSYPIGALALRSGLLASERPDPLALLRASAQVDDVIGLAFRPNESGQVVVLGASGTNLVSVREGLREWDPARIHGASLGYEEISRAAGRLSTMTDAERANLVGIEPGRERTIHIGALILERFLFALRAEACAVSVRGWRHAWLEHSFHH